MGLRKWFSKKSNKEEEEKPKISPEKWYLRWEYEETPPQDWRGLLFSPCPERAIVTVGQNSSSSEIPEEVTLTQIMKYYMIQEEGKTLYDEMGASSVAFRARFTPDLYREVGSDSLLYISAPDGSVRGFPVNRATTGKLRHKNITRVFGWCEDRDSHTFSVVQEPLADGALYSHLHFPHVINSPGLSWQRRYSAARDLAAAVHYLNEEFENTCLHMDIGSQSVFFDADGNAKLANLGVFGFEDETSVTVLVMGTSYCATMMPKGEKHSQRSNARGFGNVVLEMACGIDQAALESKQVTAWQYAMEFYAKGCVLDAVDPMLGDDFDRGKMERLLLVGLWCALPDGELRPTITEAVKYLDFLVTLPAQLPMKTMQDFDKSRRSRQGSIAELRAARAAQVNHRHPTVVGSADRVLSPPHRESCDRPTSSVKTPPSGADGYQSGTHQPRVGVDDLSPVAVRDGGDAEEPRVNNDDPAPVPVVDNPDVVEAFDIGVPPGYRCSGEPLREFQAKLLESVVEGLREGLEREPGFDETLEMVRKYTQALVALAIPVGNWNALVQDILRAARLVERFKRGEVGGEDPRSRDLGALREEIEHCTRKMEGLEEEKGMLAVKQVELQNQVGKIQREMKEVEDELRSVKTRKGREEELLDRSRKEVEMLEMVQSVLHKLSDFTCGEE